MYADEAAEKATKIVTEKVTNQLMKLFSILIKNNDMEQLVDELVVSMNLKEILRDGGTKVYVDDENKISSNGLTIVICNRINSDNTVEDIYIGGTQLNNYDYCQEIK